MAKRMISFIVLLAASLLLFGCGGDTKETKSGDNNNTNTEENNNNGNTNQEVDDTDESGKTTVSLMIHWDEEAFENTFNQHVKEALPHITLKYIQARDNEDIEENFAKGLIPDLVMGSNFRNFKELDLVRDQMPLIEKHGFDLGLYDPGIIESLENASVEGSLNALPVFRPNHIMAYNKDIFDAFGVPYPTDHMTWDEFIELGKQLSGEIDGQKYHGLHPGRTWGMSQVGITLLDAETGEPNILDNEDLRVFLERQQTIFNIPGNLPEADSMEELATSFIDDPGADALFDFALYPARDQTNAFLYREAELGLNFDWVTFPVWGGDYPDAQPNELYNNIFVTSQAEDPDAAFEVLAYLMSEEYQRWSVSNANSTALLKDELYDDFGKQLDNADILADKNTDALFKLQGAAIPEKSQYEGPVTKPLMINAYTRLLEGDDINTVLRIMDEEARNMVTELKGKE